MNPPGLNDRSEKRADRRYKVRFRLNFTSESFPEVEGEVTDLSHGGCFVMCDEVVREGELVKLRFDMPGHDDLVLWGSVVFRAGSRGFGVRFTAFSLRGAGDKLEMILDEVSRRS